MATTVLDVVMTEAGADAPAPLPRHLKPRGSLADAIRARRECGPCWEQQQSAAAPSSHGTTPGAQPAPGPFDG